MEITGKTYCGKVEDEMDSYSRYPAWSNEVANDLQIGHHRPTLEQLNAKGWMVYIDTVYDLAIEKLALVFTDDGSIISKAKIDLTTNDLDLLASAKITRLEIEIDSLCDEHVSRHVDPVEKAHWMGVALAAGRKQVLWATDQFNDVPDPIAFPPLTAEESALWSNLAIVQKLTSPCRDAATAIKTSLYMMTSEEIIALPTDWVATHNSWPQ